MNIKTNDENSKFDFKFSNSNSIFINILKEEKKYE